MLNIIKKPFKIIELPKKSKKPENQAEAAVLPAKNKKPGFRPKVSIKWNIFFWLTVFALLILVTLWLCQVVFLDDIYKTIKISEIKTAAAAIKAGIDSDDIKAKAENIAYKGEICMLALKIVNNNTAVRLFDQYPIEDCLLKKTDENSKFILYDSTVANGGNLLQRFRYDEDSRVYYSVGDSVYGEKTSDPESIIYTSIIKDKSGGSVLLILNSVISPVSATVRTLNMLLAVISVFLLTLSLGLSFIISRRVSKPIIEINNKAKRLAARDYEASFPQKGYREIAELGGTLNYAARELSKVDALYRELIANISHDLRTPLTMITGYSEVIRDLPGENTPENIQIIIDEANRLTSLVNDVLDISRFQSGVQKFEPAVFSLTAAVGAALERYARLVERGGYIIEFDKDEEVFVNSDQNRIMQVLYNLLNNAVTYTGADRRVTVRQITQGCKVRIEVTDTGDGIEEDKLESIWERYYKADRVHRRAAAGTGLGLSIVKSIMKMAGGSCGVRSKIGLGSTFWFELDIYDPAK